MSKKRISPSIFTAEGHVLLARYFGVEPPTDGPLPTLRQAARRAGSGKDPDDHPDVSVEAAAVARIVLERVQHRLPTHVALLPDEGGIAFGRRLLPAPRRPILMHPASVGTINWVVSGPGLDWPCEYHVAFVPEYDRYVVTESHDSDESWGVNDFAVGWFVLPEDAGRPSLKRAVADVLRKRWEALCDDLCQDRFERVERPGLFTAEELEALADAVWTLEFEDEDEDEDERGDDTLDDDHRAGGGA